MSERDSSETESTNSDPSQGRSLYNIVRSLSWNEIIAGAIIGAIIGLLFSLLLSPILGPKVTRLYTNHEVLGHDQPDLSVEADNFPTSFDSGTKFERFNNLSWKEDYRLYSVRVKHQGGPDVKRLNLQPHLPGCVVSYNVKTSKFGKDIRVLGSNYGGIGTQNQLNTRHCSPTIELDSLPDGEEFEVEFITSNNFNRCDVLIGYNPSTEFPVKYSWSKSEVEFTHNKIEEVELADEDYAKMPNRLDNSTELSVAGNGSVYIYGIKSGNQGHVLGECLEEQR